jgi:hypothetical protein
MTHAKAGCTKCDVGKYSAGGFATTCISCVAGKFNDVAGAMACKSARCPAGKYTDEAGQSAAETPCKSCADGEYIEGLNAGSDTTCAVGRCNAGSSLTSTLDGTTCTPCAANSWSIGGSGSCNACLDVKVKDVTAIESLKPDGAANQPSGVINNNDTEITVGFTITGRVYDKSAVILSGFRTDSATPAGSIAIEGASAAAYGNTGVWNPSDGTLTLTVADGTSIAKNSVAEACSTQTSSTACNAITYGNGESGAPYAPTGVLNTMGTASNLYPSVCVWSSGSCWPRSENLDVQPRDKALGAVLAVDDVVTRGPSWRWGSQDGGAGNTGTVKQVTLGAGNNEWEKIAAVAWDGQGGSPRNYRYHPAPPSSTNLYRGPNTDTLTNANVIHAYKDFHFFPWGWNPVVADFPPQTVKFTLQSPSGYAGRRFITVDVGKDIPSGLGSGVMYPYTSATNSATKIFSGEPLLSAVTMTEASPTGGQQFNQDRTVTFSFTANLVGSGMIKAGTVVKLDNVLTGSADTNELALTGASSAAFGSKAVLNKCDRTITLTVASDIGTTDKAVTVGFTLKSVNYATTGGAVVVSATSFDGQGTTYPDDDIDPAVAVSSAGVLATSSQPVALSPSRVIAKFAGPVVATPLTGLEKMTFATGSCSDLSAGAGSAAQSATVTNAAGSNQVTIPASTLEAGMFKTCFQPNDGCAAQAAVSLAATLTVIKTPTFAPTSMTAGTATTITFTGASEGDKVVLTSDSACANLVSSPAVENTSGRTTSLTLSASLTISAPATLTVIGGVHVCFATKESAASDGGWQSIGTLDIAGATTAPVAPTVPVLGAASGAAPTALVATIIAVLVAQMVWM